MITLSTQATNKLIRFLEDIAKDKSVAVPSKAYARLAMAMLKDKKNDCPRCFRVVPRDGAWFTEKIVKTKAVETWGPFSSDELAWRKARKVSLLAQGRQRRRRSI